MCTFGNASMTNYSIKSIYTLSRKKKNPFIPFHKKIKKKNPFIAGNERAYTPSVINNCHLRGWNSL